MSQNGNRLECLRHVTGKPTEKKPLRRLRHRWGNNVRMVLNEAGIGLSRLRIALLNVALDLKVRKAMELVKMGLGAI